MSDTTTPGGSARVVTLARWPRRVAGRVVDWAIVVGFLMAFALVAHLFDAPYLVSGGNRLDATEFGVWAWLAIVVSILWIAVQVWLSVKTGRTVGKWAVGTRIVRDDDAAPAASASIVGRALLNIVIACSAFFTFFIVPLVNYLWPLWDKKRQTLVDKLAHVAVIVE